MEHFRSADVSSIDMESVSWLICDMARQTGSFDDYVSLHVAALAYRSPEMTREFWRAKFIGGLHPDLAKVAGQMRDTTNQELVNGIKDYIWRTGWRPKPVPTRPAFILNSARLPSRRTA